METLASMLGRAHHDSHRQLCAVARRYAVSDPEGIVQEAYVRALAHGDRFRRRASVATWLHRMVINACIDEWRRRSSRGVEEPGYARVPVKTPTLTHELWVRAALMALTDSDRQMCVLCYVMGYTHREIAARHGIPVGTSKTRLLTARRRLRVALDPAAKA